MTVHTFPLDRPITLQCRFGFGSLTIEAVDGLTEAQVDVRAQDAKSDIESRCTVTLHGRTLVLAAPRPNGGLLDLATRHDQRDALDIRLRLPTGTPIKVGTHTSIIDTRGRLGTADISGGALQARVESLDGDLRLRFGSGQARFGSVGGNVSIKSGRGEVSVGSVGRSADIALGSGDVLVGTAHGSVRFRTGSGSMTVERAEGDLVMDSGNGDARVGLPSGISARLDIVTGKGVLSTDMPVAERRPDGRTSTIRVRTGRGDVSISRSPDADMLAG